jgi:hypothetical protein
MPETPTTIGQLAEQVRAKNAGPFWMTLDVFLSTDCDYQTLVDAHAVTPERVGRLYDVDPDSVEVFHMPHIRVIKVSFPRKVTAGSFEDRDQHAGQQHVPLSLAPLHVSDDSGSAGDRQAAAAQLPS